MNQTPTMGRIVIYIDSMGFKYPAIILYVFEENMLDLHVFGYPHDSLNGHTRGKVDYAPVGENKPVSWHWPLEKVFK